MEEHEVLQSETVEQNSFDDIFLDDDHDCFELDFSRDERRFYVEK